MYRFGMLAGMWGGRNYQNMTLALEVRKAYMRVQPSEVKSSDQVEIIIANTFFLFYFLYKIYFVRFDKLKQNNL